MLIGSLGRDCSKRVTRALGEQLISFSDGITEAMSAAGEPYGDAGMPAGELVEAITQLVDQHAAGAPQADDMTLLIVQRQA
ncbi:MAG TPA: SpoIIE family protein phosphatase [Roseiflexaceae bacterium]|nr:SpoIIE family protein phosphatase [Roseiflexaceae bacterium]